MHSCKENNNNHSKINFDVSKWDNKQTVPYKLIKSIKFIPLETKNDNLLGKVNKIFATNDIIYVLDMRYTKKIFAFNKEGKYLNSIGHRGKGPGEYLSINDFIVDEKRNTLQILDSELRKVLIYDAINGKFIKEFKLNFWATEFAMPSNNTLLFFSKDQPSKVGIKYSIARLNTENMNYDWFLKKDEYDRLLSSEFSIFQSQNIYYTSYLNDVVYQLTDNEIRPFATFNFGTQKIPSDKLKKIAFNDIQSLIKLLHEENWSYNIDNFLDNDELITFDFTLEGRRVFVIYSKLSSNYYYGHRYEGPLSKLRVIKNIATDNNRFLGVIDADVFRNLKNDIMEKGDASLKIHYQQVLTSVTKDSNPIIISFEYYNF